MSAPEPQIVIKGCRVERVVDGDTIELSLTRKFRVRLADNWAPETRATKHPSEKPQGLLAKAALQRLAEWQDAEQSECTLEIVPDGDGDIGDGLTFGRVVGRVWMGSQDQSLGQRMRKLGHAFATKEQLERHLDETDKQLENETRNNGGSIVNAIKKLFGCLLILVAVASSANAGSGIYSFEQECRTGNCPITAGPATCVAVGHTSDGRSCLLTAAHCVSQRENQFFAVGSTGKRYPAKLVYASSSIDLAALIVDARLSAAKIRFSVPQAGDMVTLSGLLTRRLEESSGHFDHVDNGGNRLWCKRVWSHSGMSGGAMTDEDGFLFAIHHSRLTDRAETLSAPIKPAIDAFQRRYGRLTFAAGSLVTEQGYADCAPCQQLLRSRSRSVTRSSSNGVCNCPPQTPSRYQPAPAQVSVSVDYQRLVSEFYQRYGDQLRGRDGADGKPGNVDLQQLAAVIVSRYGDRLRGERGEPGKDGGRGAQGQKGDQGPRGLIGVPDDEDIRNWLIGATADPEAKKALAAILTDIAAVDPRVDELIRRLEAVENRPNGSFTETPQRVLIVDGSTKTVLDDEVFQPGEPIVLDVRKLTESTK